MVDSTIGGADAPRGHRALAGGAPAGRRRVHGGHLHSGAVPSIGPAVVAGSLALLEPLDQMRHSMHRKLGRLGSHSPRLPARVRRKPLYSGGFDALGTVGLVECRVVGTCRRERDVGFGPGGPDLNRGPCGPDPNRGPRSPDPNRGPRSPDPNRGPRSPDPNRGIRIHHRGALRPLGLTGRERDRL